MMSKWSLILKKEIKHLEFTLVYGYKSCTSDNETQREGRRNYDLRYSPSKWRHNMNFKLLSHSSQLFIIGNKDKAEPLICPLNSFLNLVSLTIHLNLSNTYLTY